QLTEVEERRYASATTGNFQEVVKRLATESIDAIGSDHATLKIGFPKTSRDKFNLPADALPRGVTVVYDEKLAEELGGVVASDSEGKIAYRNTFRARLDRLDRELLTLVSSTIFGEKRPGQREATSEYE